jgi:carbon monoxide dehydrogenase subunit G
MLKLKSQTFEIQAEPQRVLEFLATTANYALLLPSDQTSDFQANSTQFSFKAAGQVNLALEKQNLSSDRIQFIGLKSNPFAFDLIIHVLPLGSQTTGHIEINADLNMMLKMLIEKPLQKLLVEMADNLRKALAVQ